ncbi:MAG: hypothetical protein JKY48_08035, partial [Flavobacteriales bacterium]|nr:hypothetical protein [Flavobacteriales bacterium]
MKWEKIGKIFNPNEHNLTNNCFEYAQSPQVLELDDVIRVYFSTRELDESGKFLSHVSFVDYTKDFKQIVRVSDKTVIPLGDLGCFDEHGIFPFSVTKYKDKISAYTTGWNRKKSVSVDASIGLAYSTDGGETFEKHGKGPVMTASLYEPFLVGDAFVKNFNELYYMFYIYGVRWINDDQGVPQRVYKIAQSTSEDGINWKRNAKTIISDSIDENECQALPTVVKHNGLYHMYFCYRNAFGFREDKDKAYRIGYAYSENLTDWTRDDENAGIATSIDDWDSDMMCYPYVFESNNNVYLLYNGNNFGRDGFGL